MARLKSAKREAFAQALADGETLTRAAERANYGGGDRGNASRLAQQPDIVGRVTELKALKAEKDNPPDVGAMTGDQLQQLAVRQAYGMNKPEVLAAVAKIRGEADGSLAALDITKATKDMPDATLAIQVLPIMQRVFLKLGRSIPDDDKLLAAIVYGMGNNGTFDEPKQESR